MPPSPYPNSTYYTCFRNSVDTEKPSVIQSMQIWCIDSSIRRRGDRTMKRSLWTLCVLLLAAQLSVGQYTSGVEGTALDQTGSALPNAKVLITNEATQVSRETTTNGSGYFRVSELLPGIYRVEVQMVGFQNWMESSLQIDAN